ncbi:putative class I SAM-dependent methyltransferase [Blattamonas nauphoetae]|uniref:Class I SAM-dependent methyltransferase n=1 Tax=Blattamonas nauphoetae TaxID=2049346 RepID=A0ABQ9YLN2_9EUKA|nr:putative class I SAM-dependent methyltransferase [Blattamonas nauphoetae]
MSCDSSPSPPLEEGAKPTYVEPLSKSDISFFILSAASLLIGIIGRKKGGDLFCFLGISVGTILLIVGLYLSYQTKYGSIRARDMILKEVEDLIVGNEQILDVGTGNGALLVGFAKLLNKGGVAHGVDVFTAVTDDNVSRRKHRKALSLPYRNAKLEGVADRVKIIGGDPRNLPFKTESFDFAILSMLVHNMSAGTLDRTLVQMTRVVKNGGYVIVHDFWNMTHVEDLLKRFNLEIVKVFHSDAILPLQNCIIAKKPEGGILIPDEVVESTKSKVTAPIKLNELTKEQEEELKKLKKL